MYCFENIIGFTRTECPCFTELSGSSGDAEASTSGLYMDELEETSHILPVIKNIADCGKNMEKHFSEARAGAIIDFREKVMMEIGTRYNEKQAAFKGLIGQKSFTGNVSLSVNYAGASYEMKPLKGGVFKLKKLHLYFNTTGYVTIEIWKAYSINGSYQLQELMCPQITKSVTADTESNYTFTSPLSLPLVDDSSHIVHYLVLYDRSSGFLPKNNPAACGCTRQYDIEKWILQGGVSGNDKQTIRTSSRQTGSLGYINGIIAEAEISCVDTGFICENYENSPFIKTAIEHAILYQAASRLLNSILRSDDISRYVLTKREQMKSDAAILHNKFKSRVAWISENMSMGDNNCFVCNTRNDFNGPYKAGIRF